MADLESSTIVISDSDDDINVVSNSFRNINVPLLLRSPTKNKEAPPIPKQVLNTLSKLMSKIEKRLKRQLQILQTNNNNNKEISSYENIIDGFQLINFENLLFGQSSSMYTFYLNSLRNTLPDPRNLSSWKKSNNSKCALCGQGPSGFVHILSACTTSLDEGRYSYRHDKVLEIIREAIGLSLARVNRSSCDTSNSIFKKASDWQIITDKRNKSYTFPQNLFQTKLRPDILVFSRILKLVVLVELSVPFENFIPKQHLKKTEKYSSLVEGLKRNGFQVYFYALEVSIRGIPTLLVKTFLCDIGLNNEQVSSYVNRICKKAIQASYCVWVHRKSKWDDGFGNFEPYSIDVATNYGVDICDVQL